MSKEKGIINHKFICNCGIEVNVQTDLINFSQKYNLCSMCQKMNENQKKKIKNI